MRALFLAAAISSFSTIGFSASDTPRMQVPCQQNVDNGKIVVDGSVLPAGMNFDIEDYRPARREEMWTFGECKIRLKKASSR